MPSSEPLGTPPACGTSGLSGCTIRTVTRAGLPLAISATEWAPGGCAHSLARATPPTPSHPPGAAPVVPSLAARARSPSLCHSRNTLNPTGARAPPRTGPPCSLVSPQRPPALPPAAPIAPPPPPLPFPAAPPPQPPAPARAPRPRAPRPPRPPRPLPLRARPPPPPPSGARGAGRAREPPRGSARGHPPPPPRPGLRSADSTRPPLLAGEGGPAPRGRAPGGGAPCSARGRAGG